MITSAAALADFCRTAQQHDFLAVDTEFVRTRTYYARLGLVQVKAGEVTALIDPVAVHADAGETGMAPLWQLFSDPKMTLVIHAGGEDYEILHQHMGQLPNAIFDSQIASAMLGDGDAMGYAALVEQRLGVAIDKSQSRTDWMKRPLDVEQLDYAAADVFYLHQLYPQLLDLALAQEKHQLILQEGAWQAHKRAQTIADEWLFLYLGNAWQCNTEQLSVLREVVAWRQQRARHSDLPLGFIAKEHVLLDIARQQPDSKNKLRQFADLSPVTIKYAGDSLLEAVARGKANGPLAINLQRLTDLPNYKASFNAIKKIAQAAADELGINVAMVASRRQINDVLHWCWQIPSHAQDQLPLPDLFASWRGAKLKSSIEELLN
ncbi:Ribonuclease D [Pseudidiomarina piscicola]|uniref:Ribonuclease D n=2 Tax=Pseudidiomarina piscicola TaxID=2614830 RepID=A0A6S6WTB0_9GAMM|nr:Ribonuclease D [Pseudidiomarina piscicola]VZT39147.1 Ribonuclease D [Pseudomonas aeruginosa]